MREGLEWWTEIYKIHVLVLVDFLFLVFEGVGYSEQAMALDVCFFNIILGGGIAITQLSDTQVF